MIDYEFNVYMLNCFIPQTVVQLLIDFLAYEILCALNWMAFRYYRANCFLSGKLVDLSSFFFPSEWQNIQYTYK